MNSVFSRASFRSQSIRKRDRDGVSICAYSMFLLTNWAHFFIFMPHDGELLALGLLTGTGATLMYAAWIKGYFCFRLDAQGRQTLRYRRLRTSAILLGTLFASNFLLEVYFSQP